MRGFSSIGLVGPKDQANIGGVLRAAYAYDAKLVVIQGCRARVRCITDTTKAWRHMPVIRGDDLHAMVPYDAVPIAVDLIEGAVSLVDYKHPQRAFYIFGPEDGTLGASIVDWCRDMVKVPTRVCMNLAATVNVVLYDRLAKSGDVA